MSDTKDTAKDSSKDTPKDTAPKVEEVTVDDDDDADLTPAGEESTAFVAEAVGAAGGLASAAGTGVDIPNTTSDVEDTPTG